MLCLAIDPRICQNNALVVLCAENWDFHIFCRLSDNGAVYSTSEMIWTGGGWQSGSITVNVLSAYKHTAYLTCVPKRFDILILSLVACNISFTSP